MIHSFGTHQAVFPFFSSIFLLFGFHFISPQDPQLVYLSVWMILYVSRVNHRGLSMAFMHARPLRLGGDDLFRPRFSLR